MHSAFTGVQDFKLPALLSMPIDWFIFAGFYLLWWQRKETRQKYDIQMIVHLFFFSGVAYCDNKKRVFIFDYDTKEKEHTNTRQSD
jgi:hypothetical protein